MLNSYPPSAAYMHQWTGSALVQVMACRLFGAKPLPEPMLTYCQLEFWSLNWNSVIFIQENAFKNVVWQAEWRPFCPGGDELIQQYSWMLQEAPMCKHICPAGWHPFAWERVISTTTNGKSSRKWQVECPLWGLNTVIRWVVGTSLISPTQEGDSVNTTTWCQKWDSIWWCTLWLLMTETMYEQQYI